MTNLIINYFLENAENEESIIKFLFLLLTLTLTLTVAATNIKKLLNFLNPQRDIKLKD